MKAAGRNPGWAWNNQTRRFFPDFALLHPGYNGLRGNLTPADTPTAS
jgi:hypothetical protein